jgi:hypothetical protein
VVFERHFVPPFRSEEICWQLELPRPDHRGSGSPLCVLLLTVHLLGERLRLPGRETGSARSPAKAHPAVQPQNRSTPSMSPDSSLDRESFQQLLANAFAVQESQMDRQSLSAIVEVERLIAKGELDVDGAMHLIVDCARNVANATGVAIGLLKGDQLVYRIIVVGKISPCSCVLSVFV